MTKGIGCMTSPKSTRNKLDRLQKLVRSREPLPTTSTPTPKEENTDSKDPLSRLENELLGERSEGGAPLTVKERLERLVDAASRSRPKSLHALDEAERQIVSLDEVLNGQGMENDHGQFYTIDYEYSFDYCHGQTDLSRLKSVPSSSLSVLARGNDDMDLDLYADRLLGYRNNGTRWRLRDLRISRRNRIPGGRALQGAPVLYARLLRRGSHAPRACASSFRLRESRQLQR